MKYFRYQSFAVLLANMIGAGCTSGHANHSHDGGTPASANVSYAGQQARAIKALSAQEEQDLRLGKGMGLAKAAELNGYPGPMHTLELARAMQLSEAQRASTLALMNNHKAAVKALGEKLIDEERNLDSLFAQKKITPESLDVLTQKIGQLQAQIRAEHLRTHLAQAALLSREQIAKYNTLRGYVN
jgi:Heavy-metal resistance